MQREQRRGRQVAMGKEELDEFLARERTCRLATSSPAGPHLTALWFAWDGTALWIYSIVRSQRWTDLERDPGVAVLVDAGEDYSELRGVELRGTVEFVGAMPWTGVPMSISRMLPSARPWVSMERMAPRPKRSSISRQASQPRTAGPSMSRI